MYGRVFCVVLSESHPRPFLCCDWVRYILCTAENQNHSVFCPPVWKLVSFVLLVVYNLLCHWQGIDSHVVPAENHSCVCVCVGCVVLCVHARMRKQERDKRCFKWCFNLEFCAWIKWTLLNVTIMWQHRTLCFIFSCLAIKRHLCKETTASMYVIIIIIMFIYIAHIPE